MKEIEMLEKIKNSLKEPFESIIANGVNSSNLDYLYKLIDVQKDIANIEYWKIKEDNMRYNTYGRYDEGHYGRRSYDRRYKGHRPEDKIDEMYMNYQAYSDGKEAYNRGSYSAKEDSMVCLEYMLESMKDFAKMLKEEASSQEELDMIHKYFHEISEM